MTRSHDRIPQLLAENGKLKAEVALLRKLAQAVAYDASMAEVNARLNDYKHWLANEQKSEGALRPPETAVERHGRCLSCGFWPEDPSPSREPVAMCSRRP